MTDDIREAQGELSTQDAQGELSTRDVQAELNTRDVQGELSTRAAQGEQNAREEEMAVAKTDMQVAGESDGGTPVQVDVFSAESVSAEDTRSHEHERGRGRSHGRGRGRGRTFAKYAGLSALFLAILLAILLALGALFSPKGNSSEDGMIEARGHGFLAEPENTLDAVFLGTSVVSTGISPMEIYEQNGITSFVCAANGQQTDYGYSVLKEVFETQQPKVVVFEVDMLYVPFEYDRAIKQYGKDFLSVIKYHHRWKSLTAEDFSLASVTYDDIDDMKGFNPKTLSAVPPDYETYMLPTDEVELPEQVHIWLLGIINDLCEQNGAELVLLSVPHTWGWNTARHNGIQQVADDLGVRFLDFNENAEEIGIDWQTDSRDGAAHLNYKGAIKVSRAFGDYLAETFGLPDPEHDAATVQLWDECLEGYHATMQDVRDHPENYDVTGTEVY